MRFVIASNDESIAIDLMERVLHESRDCADVQTSSLDEVVDRTSQLRPDVVVIVIPTDSELALKVVSEVQEAFPTRILTVGSTPDAKLILRLLRQGAYQYIDLEEIDAEFGPVLQRLRNESPKSVEHGTVITVLGVSGGAGASTLATSIATSLSQAYEKCALVDLKLEAGDLATLLNLQPENSLADFCQHMSRMDQSMFASCWTRHKSGIHLLAPPTQFSEIENITPTVVRKALSMARLMFPYVVVDLEHSYRPVYAQAMHQSDIILLVMRSDFTSLRQARRRLEYLEELRIEKSRVRLIVNRFRRSKELQGKDIEEALGMSVSNYVPDDPTTVDRATNKGIPVVLEKPRAEVSKCLMGIAQNVNGRN